MSSPPKKDKNKFLKPSAAPPRPGPVPRPGPHAGVDSPLNISNNVNTIIVTPVPPKIELSSLSSSLFIEADHDVRVKGKDKGKIEVNGKDYKTTTIILPPPPVNNGEVKSAGSGSTFLMPPTPAVGLKSNVSLNVVGKKSKTSVGSGYSMLDWMRKAGTRTDFVPDLRREIGPDELANHNRLGDCWMALGGKIYDVSDYANYHPGGLDELMKGAGKDGTQLFMEAHNFVNWDPILKYRQIGVFVQQDTLGRKGDKDKDMLCQTREVSSKCSNLNCSKAIVIKPKNTTLVSCLSFTEDDNNVYVQVASKPLPVRKMMNQESWTIALLNREKFILKLYLKPPELWLAHIKLLYQLQNERIQIEYQNDFRNLRLTFEKPVEKIKWKALGTSLVDDNQVLRFPNVIDDMTLATLYSIEPVTRDTNLYTFELSPSCHLGVPIGYHFKMRVNGVCRRITPVCINLDRRLTREPFVENGQMIYSIIKIYPRGVFTQQLDQLSLGETCWIGSSSGSFDIQWVENTKYLVFLAAGTGITPFVRILRHCLDRKQTDMESVEFLLVFFNKTENDIIWEKRWTLIQEHYPRFHFFPCLSQPSNTNWTGLIGRVSSEIVQNVTSNIIPENEKNNTKFLICGSDGFNSAAKSAAQAAGFTNDDSYFIFSG